MNDLALDKILAALVVEVDEVSFCEVAAGAAVVIDAENALEVHYVLAGTLFVQTPLGRSEVSAGGVVIVPPGVHQQMAGEEKPDRIFNAADICSVRPNGMFTLDAARDDLPALKVVCGHVRADFSGSFGPLQGLEQPISVALNDQPVVLAAFETMLREVGSVELGSRAIISALMKACLILALRSHAGVHGVAKTLPGLFQQPSLARAVATILEDASVPLSLNSLAKISGMSRSKFAKIFAEKLGTTPMEFVARTRLARGRTLILSTDLPVSDIAIMVGFSSRSHFSRAFSNAFGADPTSLRRTAALEL
ncbi:MAG: AraC family transcriptional regulator [Sphingomonas sp.]|jgi:AraC-like DNA-binding protein